MLCPLASLVGELLRPFSGLDFADVNMPCESTARLFNFSRLTPVVYHKLFKIEQRWRTLEHFEFDEVEFFRAVQASEVRALLIGRRALVALGLPVLTADYDFWIHIDDIQALNGALEPFGLTPTRSSAGSAPYRALRARER